MIILMRFIFILAFPILALADNDVAYKQFSGSGLDSGILLGRLDQRLAGWCFNCRKLTKRFGIFLDFLEGPSRAPP